MKRLLRKTVVWILPVCVALCPFPAAGEDPDIPLQFIALKDGTLIRGRLTSVEKGGYIIKTDHLGEIRVNPNDIQSISPEKFQRKESAPVLPRSSNITGTLEPQILNSPNAMQAVQETMLSDPQIFTLIQDLMQDPDVVKIIQDSGLMDDITTMNPDTIQQNPDFQRLLQNPKIQKIIQTFTQKHIKQP